MGNHLSTELETKLSRVHFVSWLAVKSMFKTPDDQCIYLQWHSYRQLHDDVMHRVPVFHARNFGNVANTTEAEFLLFLF